MTYEIHFDRSYDLNITSFVNISGKLFDIEKRFENHLE